jgi:alkanesulfonate monooxygenase SsuD/methylene tetrahydromethanopterin reductase-like flavin-dependent oxidoreductase (luciferase family)
MRFGIQLFPSCTAPELVSETRQGDWERRRSGDRSTLHAPSYTKRALSQHPFDTVWLPNHLSYENVFVNRAALITQTEAHVGTSVAHFFSRIPVDLGASFATLSHLAGERGITVGLGTGAATWNMIRNSAGAHASRMVLLLGEFFAGGKSNFGDFPDLTEFFRLDAAAQTPLHLPPVKPPEIFVPGGGWRH